MAVAVLLMASATGAFADAPSRAQAMQPSCRRPSAPSAQAAKAVARHFVSWAVLRRNSLRARRLVTANLAAGTTRRDWRQGFIPVVPFVAQGRVRVTISAQASCRQTIVFDVVLRAVDAVDGGKVEQYRLDELRRRGRWLVDYWGPPAIPAPPPVSPP
jgi:hypothetical protein